MALSISQADKIVKTFADEFNGVAVYKSERLTPGHHRVIVDHGNDERSDRQERIFKQRAAQVIGREVTNEEIVFKGKQPILFYIRL